MDDGTTELGRRIGARTAGIAFAVAYLCASLCGAGGVASLERGAIVAVLSLVAGTVLARPAVDVVLDAIARDEARRKTERGEEEGA